MSRPLLKLYHRLPPPLRTAAASLRGAYLRFWRESADRERLEQIALEREHWSVHQWRIWTDERLALILHRAATRVPFYREHWTERRRRGDRSSWEQLENWPLLDKDTLRRQPRAFVADDCNVRRMFREQTSGTTGAPLDIWRSRRTVAELYAIAHARTRRWHGIPHRARCGRIGGQLVIPVQQRHPPFWVWNAAMRQLYLSTYHLAPDLIPHYLDALARYRVTCLGAYTSSLVALAQGAHRAGRRELRMLAAFTNAEPLTSEQRAVIEGAFRCPVRETYGMAESVAAGSECTAGSLHRWPEFGFLEVFQDGRPVPPGTSGEFVCTGLLNADMPLIRYRVGDRGRLADDDGLCACGRSLPRFAGIDGRNTDVLITPDGREIFWLNPVFYGLPIRESQIVQETLDRVVVRILSRDRLARSARGTIVDRLRERMGEVQVAIEEVAEIPRTSAGKLRMVVCQLSPTERAAALRGGDAEPSSS